MLYVRPAFKITKEKRAEIIETLFPRRQDTWEISGIEENVEPFTDEELTNVIKKLKAGKAPGPDGITTEMIEGLHEIAPDMMLDMLNSLLRSQSFPAPWKVAQRLNQKADTTVGAIDKWLEEHHLSLAPEKTEMVVLRGPRKREGIRLNLKGTEITPWSSLRAEVAISTNTELRADNIMAEMISGGIRKTNTGSNEPAKLEPNNPKLTKKTRGVHPEPPEECPSGRYQVPWG
ncbi:hypothetical protein NQ317_003013, partial [Molorchus minor]